MTNVLNKEVESIVRNLAIEAQVHLIIVRIGVVRKGLALLDAVGEHDVNTLSASLYQPCLLYHFGHQSATGRTVDGEDIADIHAVGESARVGDFNHIRIEKDEDVGSHL